MKVIHETKVSGAGWLCVRNEHGQWVPVFKLSPHEIRAWREATGETPIGSVRSAQRVRTAGFMQVPATIGTAWTRISKK